jgi:hypothetical protein
MSQTKPHTNICTYKVKPGKEREMIGLLEKHWPALRAAGLATDDPPLIYRSIPSGKPGETHDVERTFVEIFSWTSSEGPALAHQTPGVMAVWEPMGAICEAMDFPSFERLQIEYEE